MDQKQQSHQAGFVMIGGFLGAGKTTSILRLAAFLQKLGKRVGIITNDQAEGLVDTALAEEVDLPVREITGGCFCCRSESLVAALERLENEKRPDIFIAEPVGSCTDLMATVRIPLEKIYGKKFRYAPYSVVIDPHRAMQTLGVVYKQSLFSADINYIYRKQLEEAEIIVVNKIDVLASSHLLALRKALCLEFPDAAIFEVASREGLGVAEWFQMLMDKKSHPRPICEIDYQRYGEGEALLGWYNAKVEICFASAEYNGNRWLELFTSGLLNHFIASGVEIAHLKVCMKVGGAVAVMQSTATAQEPRFTRRFDSTFLRNEASAQVIINLRAEGDPDVLRNFVHITLKSHIDREHMSIKREEAFRPRQPTPTHRVTS